MGREKVSSNDVHRLFLQAVLSRRIMSEKVARTLWVKCKEAVASVGNVNIGAEDTEAGWNAFLERINAVLNHLDLEFRSVLDDNTNTRVFALLNRKGDEVAQMASDYSPADIAFFKAVVEQIVLSQKYVYSISSLGALRETSSVKGSTMSKAHAENLLASFVGRGWLVKSSRGRYSLGTRSLLELGAYLDKYGDECVECTICHEKVFTGIMCATPNCKTFLHKPCADSMRRARNSCPSCQAAWGAGDSGIKPLGEAAYKGQKEVRRKFANGEGEDDVDNEDDEDDEETQYMSQTLPDSEPSQSQATKSQPKAERRQSEGGKRGKKAIKKKRQQTPSDESGEENQERNDEDEDDDMEVNQSQVAKGRKNKRIERKIARPVS